MGLQRSCCGYSLKTGSLAIGYVYLVLSAIGIVMSGLSVLVLTHQEEEMKEGVDSTDPLQPVQPLAYLMTAISRVHLVNAVICVKMLIVSSLMVHGVKRNKPVLVMPWIIFVAAGMVVQSLVLYYLALALGSLGTTGMWVAAAWGVVLGFCFEMYILLVVMSHYHKMKKSSLLDEEEITM